MKLDRRQFLKVCGASAGALLLPCNSAWGSSLQNTPATGSKGMLVDLTKCIGCGWCQDACREWNHLADRKAAAREQPQTGPCLSAGTWKLPDVRVVEKDGESYRVCVKRQCMHCVDPACVSACPVGALKKTKEGPVVYDCTRCIGCRYCMVACPFGVPKFEWGEPLPKIQKCTFCADRQKEGLEPACSAACPTGALTSGDRDALIAEAEARIQANPDLYVPHVYGGDEVGGTSWLYLSPVPFEELGFPKLKTEPVTDLSEAMATFGIAGVAAGVTLQLGGLYFLSGGRGEVTKLDQKIHEDGDEGVTHENKNRTGPTPTALPKRSRSGCHRGRGGHCAPDQWVGNHH